MLDEKDLQAIAGLITASEKRTADKIENAENLILKELDRVQNNLEKQIAQLQKNLDELQQYYRITKLESENTTLLLRMIDGLSKRVEDLEKRTA